MLRYPVPQMEPVRLRLGELLVDARIITREQLEEVLDLQKSDGRRLGTLLVERELVNETQLTQILSQQLSVPWVSLYHVDFSKRLLNLVPSHVAQKYCLVPIYVRHVRGQGDTLYVAMDDPTNLDALRECASWSGLPTRAMIASPADIRRAVEIYYGVSVDSEPVGDEETVKEGKGRPDAESATGDSGDDQVDEDQSPEPEKDEEARDGQDEDQPAEEQEDLDEQASSDVEAPSEETEASTEAPEPVAEESAASVDDDEEPETRQDIKIRAPEAPDEQPAPSEDAPADEKSAAEPIASTPPPAVEPLDAGTLQPEASETAHRDSIHEVHVDEDVAPIVESAARAAKEDHDDEISVEVGEEMTLEELLAQRKKEPSDEAERAEPYKRPTSGMLSLTLLDGTTLALPRRPKQDKKRAMASLVGSFKQETTTPREARRPLSEPPRELVDEHLTGEGGLTVRDILAALRAAAHGVDSTETLGRHAQWEAMMAALLAILVRKGLITEEELLEEMRKI
jgi:type IV pilus assembly protein PilB